ncbi:MAG: O-antigen ligase family protein [Smithellaceae bacterium]
MPFFLLCITIFIMFFQPDAIYPTLAPFQPLRNSAIIALGAYCLVSFGHGFDTSFFERKETRFLLLFALLQVISALNVWSILAYEYFNIWLKTLIIYYLIYSHSKNDDRAVAISIMIMVGVSYLSYFSITDFYSGVNIYNRARGFGWYENANDIALIMVTTIPLCFMVAQITSFFVIRLFSLACICTFFYNILLTGSRQGLIALSMVLAMLIFSLRRFNRLVKCVILCIGIVGIAVTGLRTVLERSDLQDLSGQDESWLSRKEQWHAGRLMLQDHPFLGVGPGQFEDSAGSYGGQRGLAPHNTIVQVFAEGGLFAGLCYLAFNLLILQKGLFFLRNHGKLGSNTTVILKFLMIAFVGFWLCAIVSNRVFAYILYVIIAMMSGVMSQGTELEFENRKG